MIQFVGPFLRTRPRPCHVTPRVRPCPLPLPAHAPYRISWRRPLLTTPSPPPTPPTRLVHLPCVRVRRPRRIQRDVRRRDERGARMLPNAFGVFTANPSPNLSEASSGGVSAASPRQIGGQCVSFLSSGLDSLVLIWTGGPASPDADTADNEDDDAGEYLFAPAAGLFQYLGRSVRGRVLGRFWQGKRSANSCVGAGGPEASCGGVVGGSASLARGFGSVPIFCGGSLPAEGECGALSTRGRICALSLTRLARTAAHFRVYACPAIPTSPFAVPMQPPAMSPDSNDMLRAYAAKHVSIASTPLARGGLRVDQGQQHVPSPCTLRYTFLSTGDGICLAVEVPLYSEGEFFLTEAPKDDISLPAYYDTHWEHFSRGADVLSRMLDY
ncbi:hypothetical protein B0H14DRAFT_3469762 [Mycena olivaceomarginata]|nr:hypothetical protein B0H14DRAFT_3469762 [Mycena olivaceomarginata]